MKDFYNYEEIHESAYMEGYRQGQAQAQYKIVENIMKDEFSEVYVKYRQKIRRYSEYQIGLLLNILIDSYVKKNNLSSEKMEILINEL